MEIGVLHLTDAHFSTDKDFVCDKVSKIVAAIKYVYEDCDRIYVAFSGDIWGIERSGFFNGREKWAKGFENQRV